MQAKAKIQMGLKLLTEVEGDKNSFPKFLSSKRKAKTNVGPLLSEAGSLVTSDKAKVLAAFFA